MAVQSAQWPKPANIVAGFTTRSGGASAAPYDSFNMAQHVGDAVVLVAQNRMQLDQQLPGSKQWQWLEQVHGTAVVEASRCEDVLVADASYSAQVGKVCVVMTADCLPILLCDKQGQQLAAIHAGWRSLCYGIIENAIARFSGHSSDILAWLGPAIGPAAFEVGEDVRRAFAAENGGDLAMQAFVAGDCAGKYWCDLYQLATMRLNLAGVTAVYGGGFCTFADVEQFYSYRRDGVTGRMASFIYRSS